MKLGKMPGGMNVFLIGALILCFSTMNLLREIDATGGFFAWFGSADVTFVVFAAAMFIGVGLLLFMGVNVAGMLLLYTGLVLELAGTLIHIGVHKRDGSLSSTLIALFGVFVAVGMVSRAVVPDKPATPPGPPVN